MSGILVTGFEPFGGWTVNSSWEGAVALGAERRGLTLVRLPVDHARAAAELRAHLRRARPAVILLTGLAPGPALHLEAVGRPGPLSPGSSRLLRARWRAGEALRALRAQGYAAKVSSDAGGYVCDTTYWAALEEGPRRCLFLHVPPLGGAWTARRIGRAMGIVLDHAG